MPTTFKDREEAFEAKFAHDEEFRFLALARRDKLFAGWAAARLHLSTDDTEALVKRVLAVPNRGGHDQALCQLIAERLSAGGHAPAEKLPDVLERCMQDARAQLTGQPTAQSDLL